MATMWPRVLPAWVTEDTRRKAEIEVFNRLALCLDNRWSIYYSRPWWGIGPGGGEVDGEADFIVAHPDKGVLFIEVKGGGIEYDPAASQWYSTDRFSVRKRIRDPVQQAMTCKHRFLDKLKNLPDWPGEFVRFRHGVVFPDSDERETRPGFLGGYELDIFCLSRRFKAGFDQWIEQRLAPHGTRGGRGESPPGPLVLNMLESIVAAPARLHVPMGRQLTPILEQQDLLLTGQQLAAVTMLEETPRALIVGGAGTGKTLVACEMAMRLAKGNRQVCLVCLTHPLAAWIRERFKDCANVSVFEFPVLCEKLIELSGRRFDGVREALPEVATNVLRSGTTTPWDAIVVDEGQDFLPTWWDVIEQIVKQAGGILRIFYDSNQAVYARKDDLETRLGMQAFPLYNNLRNTKEIGALAEQLYEGPKIETRGPSGHAVHVIDIPTDIAVPQSVERVIWLIKEELIPPADIVILVSSEEMVTAIGRMLTARRVSWSRALAVADVPRVTVETITKFKGLESPVVVLVVDRSAANSRESAYVGVSRARARLEILGPISGTMLGEGLSNLSVI